MVEVGVFSAKGYIDVIAAKREILVMQGLVDVAHEMHNPFECLLPFHGG